MGNPVDERVAELVAAELAAAREQLGRVERDLAACDAERARLVERADRLRGEVDGWAARAGGS